MVTFICPPTAIAYARLQYFGKEIRVLEPKEFDREALFRGNYISSHALIRRQAFDMVGGYRKYPDSIEDWDLYRRILRFPWKAEKVEATIYYRIHDKNRGRNHPKECSQFWKSANLLQSPITIFTPFAGRWETFNAYLQGLKNLDFDPKLIRLHWFDTSGNEDFGKMLREALAALPFGRTTYSCAPLPELWNFTPSKLIEKRLSDQKAQYYYDMALVYAYNHLIVSCDTEYSLIVEDDIVVSPDTLTQLIKTVTRSDTVAVVTSYPSNILECQTVWKNDASGKPQFPKRRKKGIEKVDGGGFGCTLLRMDTMKSAPIYTNVYKSPPVWYDHLVFAYLRKHGEILCNWDVKVEHIKTDRNGPISELHKKTVKKAVEKSVKCLPAGQAGKV
ncbi:hypothetical protein KKC44_03470 [Patescibacteria group bacterium]|nr:hypothetical protein [Patescibacteria group bacterium]